MNRIDWNRYSKKELVEILENMDEHVWLVERLDTQDDSVGLKTCSCDLGSIPLPEDLIKIRNAAAKRVQRESPLARLLRRPSKVEHKSQRDAG